MFKGMWACSKIPSFWCLIQFADRKFHSPWPSLVSQMALDSQFVAPKQRKKKKKKKKPLKLLLVCAHSHTSPHNDTHKHSLALIDFPLPGFPPISSWSCAAWCLNFDVLCLNKDRTGRDKGSSVAVFTANNAEQNSRGRWKGRGLMTASKYAGHSCCVNLPWSQK